MKCGVTSQIFTAYHATDLPPGSVASRRNFDPVLFRAKRASERNVIWTNGPVVQVSDGFTDDFVPDRMCVLVFVLGSEKKYLCMYIYIHIYIYVDIHILI